MALEKNFTSIPIVDVGKLYSDDLAERKAVSDELGRVARDVGFFYVSNHGIDQKYISGLLDAAEDFFELPMEKKMEYYIGKSSSHKGFVPEGEENYGKESNPPDHKEAFDVGFEVPADHPLVVAKTPLLGPNRWPEEIPEFKEKVKAYYDKVFELGRRLSRGFALALDMEEDAFDKLVSFPPSKMRMIHYPFDGKAAEGAQGIGSHTDYELVTCLLTTAPGLEVLNDRGEWIDAPPVEGTLICNIGDMLEVLTGGQFKATGHRVRSVTADRYSFPLFYAVDYHTEFKPLPQFAKGGEGEYEQMMIGEHMWAQSLQTFQYCKEKIKNGEAELPENSHAPATFGNFKKLSTVAAA